MSSANSDNINSYIPIFIPFISLFLQIAPASVSRTILNKSGASGHPCLVLDFKVKAFSFCPFSKMLAVGLL